MPLSSISILAPVSSCSLRIVLPPGPITMPILGGACAALVEVAEFIMWSNDRRRARLHPDPYAGLADDELSPLPVEDTPTDGRYN